MRFIFLVNIGRLFLKARELCIPFIVFTFFRSGRDQLDEFRAGHSRVEFGKHQQWLAIDIAIWDDLDEDQVIDKDEIRFNNDPRYQILGEYWESLGGVWGGRWKDPHDPFHFEYGDKLTV